MPNQINEDELQKAIDDITSSAQNPADGGEIPAPEAAPSAAPEAAPMPDLGVPPVPPAPSAPGAFDPNAVPPLDGAVPAAPVMPPTDAPVPPTPPVEGAPVVPEMPAPVPEMPAPEAQPMGAVETPESPMVAPAEGVPEATTSAPEMPAPAGDMPEMSAGADQIKADILRDLSPLLDKVEIEPEKKFHIYKDMMVTNHDKNVIPSAYETAKLISDEQKRGEALVSLIDAIDS